MPYRKLTAGEISILRQVFGETLPYSTQELGTNDDDMGGHTNSITLAMTPRMALTIWTSDFAASSLGDRWVFVHEMAHAFNWYHGGSNMLSGLWLMAKYRTSYEDKAYPYDLWDHNDLDDYNIEQRASIIADGWYVSIMNQSPLKDRSSKPYTKDRYNYFLKQVSSAGAPRGLGTPSKFDGHGHGQMIP